MIDLSSLNVNQQKAVKSDGTVIVIAGPGTGKTKTLTTRISYLIEEKNINPKKILALTFTQKAAAEMKDRLKNLKILPYVSTFHALAVDILKKANQPVEIIPEKERTELVQLLQENNSKKITKKDTKDLSLFITQYKNNINLTDPPAVITKYNKFLKERGLIDYDDLLLQLYELLNNKEILSQYDFFYIHTDEFQDTNTLQYQLLKRLLKNNNLFIIGDPYQSIYSFRGANPEILQSLKNDFPNNQIITLNTNYRSVQKIITASSALFPKNIILKSVSTNNGEVVVIKTMNEYTEGEYVAEMINKKIGGTDLIKAGNIQEEHKREVRFSDFAVIYRTHAIGRIIEQKLADSGVPYQIVGSRTIYEQPEVAFIINLLQYIDSKNYLYLKDLLHSSVLALNPKSKRRISQIFMKDKETAVEIFIQHKESYIDSQKDIRTIFTISDLIKNIDTEAKSGNLPSLIHIVIKHPLVKEFINSNKNGKNNIHAFISSITQFYDKKNSIKKCMEYLYFLKDHEFYDPTCDKVTLLTLHASKGLEFKYAFICGFEDGIIPFDAKEQNIEEEKRLLYVGMTRAKEGLYLLTTQARNKKESIISRFYANIEKHVPIIEDEAIAKRSKQIKKWKEKKSQLQLF